jgi:hypothetical protein
MGVDRRRICFPLSARFRPAPRFLALLAVAALRVAHAASTGDCTRLAAVVPDGAANAAGFDWSTLPAVPARPAAHAYRIAVWGDSLTSARTFVDAALQATGIDKADVLPSFIQAGINVAGLVLPLRSACASAGWKTAYAYREKGETAAFSEGLVSMESSTPGDVLFLDFRFPQAATRVDGLDILYDKATADGSLLLGVAVDGQDEQLVSLSRTAARVLRIAPRAPMATVRIRLVSGQVRLHGFLPHYAGAPAVVLDVLSVPGAQMRGWRHVDAGLVAGTAGAAPDYDLILVEYGTNEGAGPVFDAREYADTLRGNLARVRTFHPHARCILIGPPDRGVAGDSMANPLKYAAVHRQIATTQRQAGAAYGCGFWDWQGEMGGPGAALRWARATPPLMQPDLTHLTAQGYETSGRAFARTHPFLVPKH